MVGNTLGPYEILEPIGTGGMGEVFAALDPRLGRRVAVKILPREWAADRERLERFRNEARLVASLSHPNVLAIFDVGEEGDVAFLVTELLEGSTLRARISTGPLDSREARSIVEGIARGLDAAHKRGIVHRDLKPENVFLTGDEGVKLLDFGIARRIASGAEPSDTTRTASLTTGPEGLVGTVGYLSPEQAKGVDVDGRSDIFSLGVVLFEMLTGAAPFNSATVAEALAAVLTHDPALPTEIAERALDLAAVTSRCLAKDRRRRFQSAREVLLALELTAEATAGKASRPPRRSLARLGDSSVAVLPFRNLSPEPDTAYFSDGVSEEIVNALSSVPGLRVAARASSFRFRGGDVDLEQAADRLGVAQLLDGTVRRAGDRVRVTVQLVDPREGATLWSEHYDGKLGDVFAIQDEIAASVAARIGAWGDTPREGKRVAIEGYELYLRGLHHLEHRRLREAVACFEQVVEGDPSYAPARSALAQGLLFLSLYGQVRPAKIAGRVEALCEEVLRDEESAAAHAVIGAWRASYDLDWVAADRHLQRAIELEPFHAQARIWRAFSAALVHGEFDRALSELERCTEVDPLGADTMPYHLLWHVPVGRLQEARELAERAVAEMPDNYNLLRFAGEVFRESGDLVRALELLAAANALNPQGFSRQEFVSVLALRGRVAEATAIHEAMLAEMGAAGAFDYLPMITPALDLGREAEAREFADLARTEPILSRIFLGRGFVRSRRFYDRPWMRELARDLGLWTGPEAES